MDDVEQTLDDALAAIGIDTKPVTREDELYLILTEGKFRKIDNCRYWVMHEMAKFQFMTKECDVKLVKDVVLNGKLQMQHLTKMQYGKFSLQYYLQMYHLPYFQELNGKPAANMQKMVDLLAAYPGIKEVIEKDY